MEETQQNGYLEEFVSSIRDSTWNNYPSDLMMSNGLNLDLLEGIQVDPSFEGFLAQNNNATPFQCPYPDQTPYPFVVENGFSLEENDVSITPPFPLTQNGFAASMLQNAELGFIGGCEQQNSFVELEQQPSHSATSSTTVASLNMGFYEGNRNRNKVKKADGQPSKNLMAERRRRKRLNDRLSMLRSIVPKISKMDRTSILGDTIEYMKELLEKISRHKQEEVENGIDQISTEDLFEFKTHEVMIRNAPKFEVEKRGVATKVDVCCALKQGLLLSAVDTLDTLGLDIHQCVISSFNDFSMQAIVNQVPGYEETNQASSPEEIKQALMSTAGYGGRIM